MKVVKRYTINDEFELLLKVSNDYGQSRSAFAVVSVNEIKERPKGTDSLWAPVTSYHYWSCLADPHFNREYTKIVLERASLYFDNLNILFSSLSTIGFGTVLWPHRLSSIEQEQMAAKLVSDLEK